MTIARLIEKWEARASDAIPADAMLINRHVRELREANGWLKIADCLPDRHTLVLLINEDRFWNTPEGVAEMNRTATGYLADFGKPHWSVFGEPAMELDAFTHWMPIPEPPNVGA